MSKPVNVLITGSNYWNAGDDIVRDGVMALFRALLHPREINWHFYNFAAPQMSTGRCGEIPNTVDLNDIAHIAPFIDLVVIPGLAFGRELYDFQAKVLQYGLGPKTFFIGGMNENPYAAEWAAKLEVRRLLKQARVVIGRTTKHPGTLDSDGVAYHSLPCPSILCGPAIQPFPGSRLAMSIQLPAGLPGGVVNHVTSREAHIAALEVLNQQKAAAPVDLVCHHKSEFLYFSSLFKGDPQVSVLFSSWFQDLWGWYGRCSSVASTRLHSVLWCRALGRPGIVINDSPRHVAALGFFTGTPHTVKPAVVTEYLGTMGPGETRDKWFQFISKHQETTWQKYVKILEPHVKSLALPQ